jgi:hypothetical protein
MNATPEVAIYQAVITEKFQPTVDRPGWDTNSGADLR